MINSHPKVFISHASEDKERFVLDFARKLREKGVNAWLDKWEMKPSDSLVDKIFEEGIKECQYFLIVLSDNSVNKKWVKEELNSAVVQKIEKNTQIIPVIIDDDVEVPKVLQHTVWVRIKDLDNYEEEFNRILSTIYDYDIDGKPPLGEIPNFVNEEINVIGLNRLDSLILKIIGEIVYEKNNIITILSSSDIIEKAATYEVSKGNTIESLEILESEGYIKIQKHMGKKEDYLILTNFLGFYSYCENYIDNFENILREIASKILNEGITVNEEIAGSISYKVVIVEGVLEFWELYNYINLQKSGTGMRSRIYKITAEGRRFLRNLLR